MPAPTMGGPRIGPGVDTTLAAFDALAGPAVMLVLGAEVLNSLFRENGQKSVGPAALTALVVLGIASGSTPQS